MIKLGTYKDRPAVYVGNEKLSAAFLPDDGAKLASLVHRSDGKELLEVRPDESYKVLEYDGCYVDSECSGFDDMFPTVDPYTPDEGPFKGITYPDHGETCRIKYEVSKSDTSVTLTSRSRIFPIEYRKTISPDGSCGLNLEYCIKNNGDEPFPFLWAGHIMLHAEDGMRIITPFSKDTPTEMMFCTKGYDPSALPLDTMMGHKPQTGAAYKFYYLEKIPDGSFGIEYPNGSKLNFKFDPEKLPYLGIWINNGEFHDGYSITPEPCTVPFDAPDRAAKRGLTSIIPPKEAFSFTINISIKE